MFGQRAPRSAPFAGAEHWSAECHASTRVPSRLKWRPARTRTNISSARGLRELCRKRGPFAVESLHGKARSIFAGRRQTLSVLVQLEVRRHFPGCSYDFSLEQHARWLNGGAWRADDAARPANG